MMTVIFAGIALFLGYAVTVGLTLATTFAISSTSHDFVLRDYRIRRRFKFTQDALWLLYSIAGGYVTTWVASQNHPLVASAALAALLITVLWRNTREMRERGIPHQLVMTILSIAGVAIGYILRFR